MSQPETKRKRHWLLEPSFLTAVVVLGVAAVGLNAAVQSMQLHFRKLAVPLRHTLHDEITGVPSQLGPWMQVRKDEPLDHTMQEMLGTKEFVFREYLDTRPLPSDVVEELANKPAGERREMLAGMQSQEDVRDSMVTLNVTYYTGLTDTVPHIPERCMVADGYLPVNARTLSRTLSDGRQVEYKFMRFVDNTDKGRVAKNVLYFFQVNGALESAPLGVRRRLQRLWERYGYFAKIEMMSLCEDEEQALKMMDDLLVLALPEVERCLPDWEALNRPPAQASAAK